MWIEHLNDDHDLDTFTCGNKDMDDWLHRHARGNEAIGVSRTYVLTDDGRKVIGYYTLTGIGEQQADLPRSLRRGTPQGVDQPGALLARLAVDIQHQNLHLGTALMVDAVRTVVQSAELVPCRFIPIDPIDERAREIYEGWGFTGVPGDRRMYITMNEAIAAFLEVEGD